MDSLAEVDVQAALATCLQSCSSFRDSFLQTIAPPDSWQAKQLGLLAATQGVIDPTGETDVETLWSAGGTSRYAILCEVKLASGFTPRQGQRYQQRAAAMVNSGRAADVLSVLIAHSSYLRGANSEARCFDRTMALDHLSDWATGPVTSSVHAASAVLRDAARRMLEGHPLGAKGLFCALHHGLADEFTKRRNGLVVTNKATDWVYVQITAKKVPGVWVSYRIRQAIPEIRIRKSYNGNRDLLIGKCLQPLQAHHSGSDLFLRLPRLDVGIDATRGQVTSDDIAVIADACEWLSDWWVHNSA